MAELIPLLYHSSGWYAGGGAVLPPNPVATGAENDGGAENGCAIGTGAGTLGVVGTLGVKDGVGALAAAPATFSCVLPKAAIPKTAPIAI